MYTVIIFLYLGSIVTQSLTKQRTDFQVPMPNFIKLKLVEELHHFGVTTTYDEFLLFKGSAACVETDKDHKRCKSNDGNNKLIQVVSDNFDCKMCSQNGVKQTHSVVVIMTQEHETVEKPLRAVEFMVLLKSLAKKSRTAHLLLKALIWPVILIIRFVRASREADWPLPIHT